MFFFLGGFIGFCEDDGEVYFFCDEAFDHFEVDFLRRDACVDEEEELFEAFSRA